jgi:hypothetical protein
MEEGREGEGRRRLKIICRNFKYQLKADFLPY